MIDIESDSIFSNGVNDIEIMEDAATQNSTRNQTLFVKHKKYMDQILKKGIC